MIKNTLAYGVFLLISCLANAQQLQLPLNIRAEDAQYNKLILVANVFEFRNDSVSNPLDISGANPEDKASWYQVKLPKDINTNYRWGYAWVLDGTSNLSVAKAYTLIAIENPAWTLYPTRLWVDKNHNFDFTDDTVVYHISHSNGVEVPLGNSDAGYKVYLEHFPSAKFRTFELMNDKTVNQLAGNRSFMGTAASLREKRLNVVASNWSNGADSFCLGIKDVNCNGIYTDAGIDVALITTYNGVFDNLQGVAVGANGTAYLEWNNAAYTVQGVDPQGRFLKVLRDTAARLKYSLNVGDKLPRFKYCAATKPSKHKSIRRLKRNYVYIYVWRDGSELFFNDSANLHALGRLNRDGFQVLGLNHGASANYVYRYNKYFETHILHGFSSNDINKKLMLKQIPTGILIDNRQRIVAAGITPSQVLQYLPKE